MKSNIQGRLKRMETKKGIGTEFRAMRLFYPVINNPHVLIDSLTGEQFGIDSLPNDCLSIIRSDKKAVSLNGRDF